jgi:hypothetical protein
MSEIYLISEVTSDFESTPVTDVGSKASAAISFWTPKPHGDFHMLGLTAAPNYNNPPALTQKLYISSGLEGLAVPTGMTMIWTCIGDHQSSNLGIYMPQAPDGFIAIGCVAVMNFNQPPDATTYAGLRCVREDLCERVTLTSDADLIWTDEGSRAPTNVSVWMLPTAQTCVATVQKSGYPTSVSVWDIKKPSLS